MDLAPEEHARQLSGPARRRVERRWAREALGLDNDHYAMSAEPVRVADRR